MKFSTVYAPGNNPLARAVRWLATRIEAALTNVETVWFWEKHDELDISFPSEYTVGILTVPKPPKGYSILIEAWCNMFWTSGTGLGVDFDIHVGGRVICHNHQRVNISKGTANVFMRQLYNATSETTFRFHFHWSELRTTGTIATRGMTARYVKEG